MRTIFLDKGWILHEAPMDWGRDALSKILAKTDGWMNCDLPCDIHTPLENAGLIRDVTKADYCYEAEWTEHRSWWFVKEFETSESDVNSDVIELTLESLDGNADIYLNGDWIGTHMSAHYPFTKGVKSRLNVGKNTLVIRMTTGLETVDDKLLSEINRAVCTEANNNRTDRSDVRRGCVRKPQYVVGWDWGPKAITCGIVKSAYISCHNTVAIRDVSIHVIGFDSEQVNAHATFEVDQLDLIGTRDCDLSIILSSNDQTYRFEKKDVLLTSGLNYIDMDLPLPGAKLWWPAGYGSQPLYEVNVSVVCEGAMVAYPAFRVGLRTVELDTSRSDDTNRNFFFVVNGVRVFCKGGNWIPADSIYARVTDEKHRLLIDEACEANFNMLRIWGGGLYERNSFYEYCDEIGMLLWHDFMFGCSTYPDHLPWFMDECKRELDYQTRRLRNHACIALWCGNNENHWLFNKVDNPQWKIDPSYEHPYGMRIYNEAAVMAVRNNCPWIPYWNSSPYGGRLPNDETCGDTHHWHPCTMNPDMAKRIEPKEYDKVRSRFVTEYGYIGPCAKESIETFFDGQPIDRNSKIWKLHTNTFEKDTVAAGIEKHYLDAAGDLSLEDYLLYSGMVQSLMLEYSLEAIRFKNFCGGGLFWMYNDTWCEVGWTIIDYYLRRKISYYGVKRAFAPVKLTLRLVNGKAVLQGCNDTDADITMPVKIGYMSFDGRVDETKPLALTLRARSRAYLAAYDLPDANDTAGAFVAIPQSDKCAPAVLRMNDRRNLKYVGAKPKILDVEHVEGGAVITLTADAFIHGVHLDGPWKMSDNYFDLLPGQVKKVRIEGGKCACGAEWKTVM